MNQDQMNETFKLLKELSLKIQKCDSVPCQTLDGIRKQLDRCSGTVVLQTLKQADILLLAESAAELIWIMCNNKCCNCTTNGDWLCCQNFLNTDLSGCFELLKAAVDFLPSADRALRNHLWTMMSKLPKGFIGHDIGEILEFNLLKNMADFPLSRWSGKDVMARLWYLGRHNHFPVLKRALESGDSNLVKLASEIVCQRMEKGGNCHAFLPIVISLLNHSNPSIRWNSLHILERFGYRAHLAIPQLLLLLREDEDTVVKDKAIGVLLFISPEHRTLAQRAMIDSALQGSLAVGLRSIIEEYQFLSRDRFEELIIPVLEELQPMLEKEKEKAADQDWWDREQDDFSDDWSNLENVLEVERQLVLELGRTTGDFQPAWKLGHALLKSDRQRDREEGWCYLLEIGERESRFQNALSPPQKERLMDRILFLYRDGSLRRVKQEEIEGIHVGIWWHHRRRIVAFLEPVRETGEPDRLIDSEMTHNDLWRIARKFLKCSMRREYYEIPRGRTLWSTEQQMGRLYHGNGTTENIRDQLQEIYRLPRRADQQDSHYLTGQALSEYLESNWD
ncbi:MAG TPA: hypothetical protein VNQ76_07535 [Planctomicrobium sp.]|nr:hypothetical protein [Planctomicrobium sp.]